jgi:hypothetical protein
MKQFGALVAVGANLGTSTLTNLSDVNISVVNDGEALIYNSGEWKNGGMQDGGNF